MAAIVLQKKMMIDMYNYGTENPNFRGGVSENWIIALTDPFSRGENRKNTMGNCKSRRSKNPLWATDN